MILVEALLMELDGPGIGEAQSTPIPGQQGMAIVPGQPVNHALQLFRQPGFQPPNALMAPTKQIVKGLGPVDRRLFHGMALGGVQGVKLITKISDEAVTIMKFRGRLYLPDLYESVIIDQRPITIPIPGVPQHSTHQGPQTLVFRMVAQQAIQ